MSNQGYVIAQSIKTNAYFTSRSSYDKPQWISIDEATVYPTAELAQNSVTKLFKRGSFAATVVPLAEVLNASMYTTQPPALAAPLADVPADHPTDDDMIASDRNEVCTSCNHEPCTCPEDIDNSADTLTINNQDVKLKTESVESVGNADRYALDVNLDNLKRDMAQADSSGDEEDKRSLTQKLNRVTDQLAKLGDVEPQGIAETEVTPVALRDLASVDDANRDAATTVASEHDAKIKVPASVKSALKAVLTKFNQCSDPDFTHDDTRASFCLTVAAATQALLDDLEQGTVAGLKQAQIHLTSYMNPITTQLPSVVTNYILSGGTKLALKDMYNDKWDTKRSEGNI